MDGTESNVIRTASGELLYITNGAAGDAKFPESPMETLAMSRGSHIIPDVNDPVHNCSKCPLTFNSSSALELHASTHNFKLFSCPDCGRCFTRRDTMVKHRLRHLDERRFECDQCEQVLTQQSLLLMHKKMHQPLSQIRQTDNQLLTQMLQIDTDQVKIDQGENMNQPMSQIQQRHSSPDKIQTLVFPVQHEHDTFQCGPGRLKKRPLSPQQQVNNGTLKFGDQLQMQQFLSNIKPKYEDQSQFVSDQIIFKNREKSRKAKLRKERIMSSDEPSTNDTGHKCMKCSRTLTDSANLQSHRHQCSKCEAVFTPSSDLMEHLASHQGFKPYSCTKCGNPTAFSAHKQTHRQLKAYPCSLCHMSFNMNYKLQVHMRTHKKKSQPVLLQASATVKQESICSIQSVVTLTDARPVSIRLKETQDHQANFTDHSKSCTSPVGGKILPINSRNVYKQDVEQTVIVIPDEPNTFNVTTNQQAKEVDLPNRVVENTPVTDRQNQNADNAKAVPFTITNIRSNHKESSSFTTTANADVNNTVSLIDNANETVIMPELTQANPHNNRQHLKETDFHTPVSQINSNIASKKSQKSYLDSFIQYVSHATVHPQNSSQFCCHCRQRFYSQHLWNKHLRSDCKGKPYCAQCRMYFNHPSGLKTHMTKTHLKPDKPIIYMANCQEAKPIKTANNNTESDEIFHTKC